MFRPLILLTSGSAPEYVLRRTAQRDAFLPQATDAGIPWLHVLADPSLSQHSLSYCLDDDERILHVACPDVYRCLPMRTRLMLQALPLLTQAYGDFTHVFKADDDTYIHIPRLLAYDPGPHDYIGAEWTAGCGYGSGGAGYILSRKAAAIVADRLTDRTGAEDLLVGHHLRTAGIPLHVEPRLIPFSLDAHDQPNLRRVPHPDNDLITGHHLGPAPLLRVHQACSAPSPA